MGEITKRLDEMFVFAIEHGHTLHAHDQFAAIYRELGALIAEQEKALELAVIENANKAAVIKVLMNEQQPAYESGVVVGLQFALSTLWGGMPKQACVDAITGMLESARAKLARMRGEQK